MLPNDPLCQSFAIIATVVKINALMSAPKQTECAASAEAHVFPALVEFHEPARLLFISDRADMTFFVIQLRCQRSSAVMDPRWSSLGEFVLTAGLPDDSRPGCWPCKCRPPFSGMSVSSFEPPSLEISSSSHHSWRLLLLFKPPPLPWAASLEFIVFEVLLIVCELDR